MVTYCSLNSKQNCQLEYYKKKLRISTEGEEFVLRCILERDWGRELILIDITRIVYNSANARGLVWVECTTTNGTYAFSVSHLGGKGWSTDDPDKQRDYIKHNLYHKLS